MNSFIFCEPDPPSSKSSSKSSTKEKAAAAEAEAAAACPVCIENYTDVRRVPVTCPYCQQAACVYCTQRYVLMHASDPKCAQCDKPWSQDVVDSLLTKNFRRNQLRIQVIANVVEREMSLLPETQALMETERKQAQYKALQDQQYNASCYWGSRPTEAQLSHFADLQRQMDALGVGPTNGPEAKPKAAVVRRTFKCPDDDCPGYITCGSTTCSLCKTRVCLKCAKNLGKSGGAAGASSTAGAAGHVCNEDDVRSVELIRSTSKPCPNCAMAIVKTEGCNQMWCVSCHTAFDWTTLRVVSGPIHNPHYHAYLKEHGPNGAGGPNGPLNVECVGQGPAAHICHVVIGDLGRWGGDACAVSTMYIRALMEAQERTGDEFAPPSEYTPQMYAGLRRRFLLSEFNKRDWAARLSQQETLRQKKLKLFQLRQMFVAAGNDLLTPLVAAVSDNNWHPRGDVKSAIGTFATGMVHLHLYLARQQLATIQNYSDKRMLMLSPFMQGANYLGNISWTSVAVADCERDMKAFETLMKRLKIIPEC